MCIYITYINYRERVNISQYSFSNHFCSKLKFIIQLSHIMNELSGDEDDDYWKHSVRKLHNNIFNEDREKVKIKVKH